MSCFRVYFSISWQDKLLNLIPSYLLLADLPAMGFTTDSGPYRAFACVKILPSQLLYLR